MAEEVEQGREPVLRVVFYRTEAGNEPVRQWLKGLDRMERKAVGEDVKTAQYGFIKKSQKTLLKDLRTARQRMAALRKE